MALSPASTRSRNMMFSNERKNSAVVSNVLSLLLGRPIYNKIKGGFIIGLFLSLCKHSLTIPHICVCHGGVVRVETWLLLGQILMINLVLSGDNALVIAMASRDLPETSRRRAVWIGTIAAVVLRCLLTFAAVILLKVPYLQAGGALLLIWISFQLMMPKAEDEVTVSGALSLWSAVNTILIADFVMSLDNVLAIAGLANGDFALIVIGIVLSIPIVVWGSGLISSLLNRFPVLLYIGAGFCHIPQAR